MDFQLLILPLLHSDELFVFCLINRNEGNLACTNLFSSNPARVPNIKYTYHDVNACFSGPALISTVTNKHLPQLLFIINYEF